MKKPITIKLIEKLVRIFTKHKKTKRKIDLDISDFLLVLLSLLPLLATITLFALLNYFTGKG